MESGRHRIAGLRRIARHAAALVLARTVLITLGLAGVVAAYQAAAGLLATGVRVEDVVLAVHQPSRGTSSFWVRYHSPGKSWTEEIVRDSDRVYYVGDAVTVVGFAGLPFAAKAAARFLFAVAGIYLIGDAARATGRSRSPTPESKADRP